MITIRNINQNQIVSNTFYCCCVVVVVVVVVVMFVIIQSPIVRGPVEANPEYKLTVDANNLIVEIDNEMSMSPISSGGGLH